MSPELDLEGLPPPAKKALSPGAPPPLKLMAAKGVIPGAKPADIVTVLTGLAGGVDAKVAEAARATLKDLPPPVLTGALSADLQAPVIHALCETRAHDHDSLGALLRMPRIATETLEFLAERADEKAGEIIATNERRLLEAPGVIERLYMNKHVRMSTADRLLELAVRNGVELNIPAFKEAAEAIQTELIPEPSEEPTFDDVLFSETQEISAQIALDEGEDTHELDEEGNEKVIEKVKPLWARITQMTTSQKIRTAALGKGEELLLLARDANRLVAAAAVQSPRMREREAIQISASRSVSDDVLRIIARNKEFTRSYQIKLNLVTNPRTPLTFASSLIPHLREADLRQVARSKNVTGAISRAAKQQMSRKADRR
ncbi:MAG: hypothetical protein AB7K71_06895 [Polyangiaceae bacterium]